MGFELDLEIPGVKILNVSRDAEVIMSLSFIARKQSHYAVSVGKQSVVSRDMVNGY